MEVTVIEKEEALRRAGLFDMFTVEDNVRYAKHLFNTKHNRMTKEICSIIGCYRTDEPVETIKAYFEQFAKNAYDLTLNGVPNGSATSHLLDIFAELLKDESSNSPAGSIIDAILAKLEYMLLHLSGNIGNLPIDVDNLMEDWDEVKLVLRNHGIDGYILTELDRLSYSILTSFHSKTMKVEINELENSKACIFSVHYSVPLIYYTAFSLRKYSKPGVMIFKPGSHVDYPVLASIANEFGTAYFKLFNDNPNRIDGCVSVFVNKITSDITLYI